MRTLTEESGSEVGSDSGREVLRPILKTSHSGHSGSASRRDPALLEPPERPLIFLQPPASSHTMDGRGWRRPSAPSIFHHFESALGRRLSGTPPVIVTPMASAPAMSPVQSATLPGSGTSRRPAPLGPACNTVALRRPSAVVLLANNTVSPAEEERRLMDSPEDIDRSTSSFTPLTSNDEYMRVTPKFDDTITVYLSAMYAKLLVTLGIAFPILETIHEDGKYYQGFYLYLYVGTFFFLSFMYGNLLKKRAVVFVVNTYRRKGSQPRPSIDSTLSGISRQVPRKHYGSFYLRLGAIAFGIGSMVYSGLEFGQFFEMSPDCRRATQALTPAARMVLTLVQMQFIFLNNREMDMLRHKVLAQFGLMHMIATNLCEWLTAIIEEAKHEIEHLPSSDPGVDHHGAPANDSHHGDGLHHRASRSHGGHAVDACFVSEILSSLVRNASPFLFPCTIEYSLICAVVLFEMWKNAHRDHGHPASTSAHHAQPRDLMAHGHGAHEHGRSANHLSLDCTKAHKGLFAGIVIVVLTIISIILFFVLNEAPGFAEQGMLVVNVCELGLYIITLLAVLCAFYQIRSLKYLKKSSGAGLGLDNTLLVLAQTGVFLYNLFSVLAYSTSGLMPRVLVSELLALIQTICQTIFILDATRRRCSSPREYRRKPGRQLVTFLLVSNMAMWIVNTLEKSRARSRPNLLEFYGKWPWTLIVHISMPLAIFYRFHSTICLFEIWKCCYKYKHPATAPSSTGSGLTVTFRKHTDSERSERDATG